MSIFCENTDIFLQFSVCNRIKYTDEKKCINHITLLGKSTAVTQKLLEHSSPDLINKVYTNVDPVLRHAVDQISVDDWL